MPTFIATNGDEFVVQKQDRGYGGRLTEVLKIDKDGVVTVAGQQISSSGVIGATGAVTATTGAFSGLLAAAAAVTVGTTLTVTGASTLTGNSTVTGTFGVTGATTLPAATTIGGKTPMTGSDHSFVGPGRNLAGDIVQAGTVAGDKLIAAVNLTDGANVASSFEQIVTVSGHLQQTAAADLSTKTIFFLYHTP
jgi:fibronectin-binding autotransporter adhesin